MSAGPVGRVAGTCASCAPPRLPADVHTTQAVVLLRPKTHGERHLLRGSIVTYCDWGGTSRVVAAIKRLSSHM
jgi:hypothetical protein